MCQICILMDNTWPSPKELAKAIVEVMPTDEHMQDIETRIVKTIRKNNSGKWLIDMNDPQDYLEKVRNELFEELFKGNK